MLSTVLLCLVVGISDGDTRTARCPSEDPAHPYQQVKVRLAEIDAPESGQAFGRRSKEHLSELCYRVEAIIRQTATDRYGRTVARVECRGVDASLAQVQAGLAWSFTRYQTDPVFPRAELAARQAGIGLWADADVRAPWDFRHAPRTLVADETGCITGPKGGRYRLKADGTKRYGC